MTALVTGRGLLANALAERLQRGGTEVRSVSRTRSSVMPSGFVVDLRFDAPPAAALEGCTTVFHTAAMTSVAGCERDPAGAHASNVDATRRVVDAAAAVGARVVYPSTDWVFDGTTGGYAEDDPAEPTCVYGQTKLHGERTVLDAGGVVLRGTFFGRRPEGIGVVERLTDPSARPTMPAHRVGSPLWVGEAVEILVAAATLPSGTYHMGSAEPVDWVELGRRVRAATLGSGEVDAVEHDDGVVRPRDTSLDVSKLAAALPWRPPTLSEVIAAIASGRALVPSPTS